MANVYISILICIALVVEASCIYKGYDAWQLHNLFPKTVVSIDNWAGDFQGPGGVSNYCSGVLISNQHVLTAGGCCHKYVM